MTRDAYDSCFFSVLISKCFFSCWKKASKSDFYTLILGCFFFHFTWKLLICIVFFFFSDQWIAKYHFFSIFKKAADMSFYVKGMRNVTTTFAFLIKKIKISRNSSIKFKKIKVVFFGFSCFWQQLILTCLRLFNLNWGGQCDRGGFFRT